MGDFWLYITMPFISAIVGWGTNVVAVKMTFYPIDFVGIKPPFLGWQGVIPSKVEKIAGISVDLMTSKLISVEEIFSRLDPKRLAEEMEPAMLDMIETITEDIMLEHAPQLWESVPIQIKDQIYARAAKESPKVIHDMMVEIQEHIEDLFDLKEMVIDAFVRDRELLVKMFQEVGHKEFEFIQISGLYFGFLFGIIQMLIWIVYKGAWVLPIAGLIVGTATNWLALKMIFEPRDPIVVGPWKILGFELGPYTIQGLFIQRQDEVAYDYGAMISSEILNPENIVEALLKGPASDRLFRLIQRHITRTLDSYPGYAKPFVTLTIGTKRFIQMKEMAVDRIFSHLPDGLKHVHAYTEEAMDIDTILRTKLKDLTADEFEGMLRPAFQEDEWILIAVGGVLGLAVGFFQLIVMFGGGV